MLGKINQSQKDQFFVATAAKSLQSCPTLYDPIHGSPPGSPIPGIPQARTLEWVAISFSNVWKWKVKVKSLSRIRLLATPWTAAYQAPLSMGFSRQEYWSGVPALNKCLFNTYIQKYTTMWTPISSLFFFLFFTGFLLGTLTLLHWRSVLLFSLDSYLVLKGLFLLLQCLRTLQGLRVQY